MNMAQAINIDKLQLIDIDDDGMDYYDMERENNNDCIKSPVICPRRLPNLSFGKLQRFKAKITK